MNSTTQECYISVKDIELAQTIATYNGVAVFSLCSCPVFRCCYYKKFC